MSEEIGEAYLSLLQKIWKGVRMPEEWRRGMVNPIFKKENGKKNRDYRGILHIRFMQGYSTATLF